ncbi:MAG: TPM domain-containing protein, partial [Alistipes sp.]|nr:TPM domain-containing protein [Alistipes sp.]
MKRLVSYFATLLIAISALSAKPYGIGDIENVQRLDRGRYTSNPDGILSAEAVVAIDRACDSLRNKGVAQVAIVVVKEIEGDDLFTFAHELFSSWGVGNKQTDNGLGIILALDKREIRFVTGEGLEGVLTDAVCKRIQQRYMVKPLGNGDYDGGMIAGMEAVATLLSSGELPVTAEEEISPEEILAIAGVLLGMVILLAAIAFIVYREAHRCPKCGKYHLQNTESHIIKETRSYQLVEKSFVCPDCGHSLTRQSRIEKGSVV